MRKPEECLERAIEIVAQYTHTHEDAVTRFYHHRRELRNPENLVIAQMVDQVILRLDAEKRAADAEAQVRQWQTWGIVEIAVRNPSVAEYMAHWEGRAFKAEAQVKALSRPVSEIWFQQWKPIINAIGEISVQEARDVIERGL